MLIESMRYKTTQGDREYLVHVNDWFQLEQGRYFELVVTDPIPDEPAEGEDAPSMMYVGYYKFSNPKNHSIFDFRKTVLDVDLPLPPGRDRPF